LPAISRIQDLYQYLSPYLAGFDFATNMKANEPLVSTSSPAKKRHRARAIESAISDVY
jgi:hypothetical protein